MEEGADLVEACVLGLGPARDPDGHERCVLGVERREALRRQGGSVLASPKVEVPLAVGEEARMHARVPNVGHDQAPDTTPDGFRPAQQLCHIDGEAVEP